MIIKKLLKQKTPCERIAKSFNIVSNTVLLFVNAI